MRRAATERDLAQMFKEFNAEYFGGRLPRYRVLFRWNRPGADGPYEGYHDRKRRQILLCPGMRGTDEIPGMLLHEMVHAAKGDQHGSRFWREWQRLERAGAPTDDNHNQIHSQHVPTRYLPRS